MADSAAAVPTDTPEWHRNTFDGEGAQVWTKRSDPGAGALPPADWYPDPDDAAQWRYWDGAAWTDHYAPRATTNGVASTSVPSGLATRGQMVPQQTTAQWPHASLPTLAELVSRARLEPPRNPLDEQVEVVGETYHIKGIKKVFREHGLPVQSGGSTLDDLQCILAPEPWNPHDPNAVAVMIGLQQVGYLPAELAREYARPLGRLAGSGVLATGVARLWAKSDAGVIRGRVTVLIPEAGLF